MFQLDFFKIVKVVCDNEPWENKYVNPHEAYVMKKKDNPYTERPNDRMLREYIQWEYPTYFGFQPRLPHEMVKHRNHITNEQQRMFFFE